MLSISILGIKDNNDKLIELDNLNPDYLHLDIMDGKFVSNTVDMSLLPELVTSKDIHLMVEDVKAYVDVYKKYNPEYITFHVEVGNTKELIDYIHSLGIKVGLSIKPGTNLAEIKPYLHMIDLVLVMSVEPGRGGQTFIEDSIARVKELSNIRIDNNYQYKIEIDGGINQDTIKLVPECDLFVVGSYITSSDNFKERISSLK
jgi:ribulose-phosphate 3-epimerase